MASLSYLVHPGCPSLDSLVRWEVHCLIDTTLEYSKVPGAYVQAWVDFGAELPLFEGIPKKRSKATDKSDYGVRSVNRRSGQESKTALSPPPADHQSAHSDRSQRNQQNARPGRTNEGREGKSAGNSGACWA